MGAVAAWDKGSDNDSMLQMPLLPQARGSEINSTAVALLAEHPILSQMTTNSPPPASSMPLDVDTKVFDCQGCGIKSNGEHADKVIQCIQCKLWSHIKCMQHPKLWRVTDNSDNWSCPICNKIEVWSDAKYA